MNFKRFYAVFKARNLEFIREKSTLGWNIIFPAFLLVAFAVIFSGDGQAVYKIGVLQDNIVKQAGEQALEQVARQAKKKPVFLQTKHINFIEYRNKSLAQLKLSQHNIDLLIDFNEQKYWVNETSPKSYLVEKIFLAEHLSFSRLLATGNKIRYVDWALPGILGMNMMFSCLFGVGYVIVRYRKNSVLKRLKATPLSAFEFVSAQLMSRLFLVMSMIVIVYTGCNYIFDFYMLGSYFDLFLIATLGAFTLITMGLLVACRSKSEELTGGLLNVLSWPMIVLSGVWFSLEGAPHSVKVFAEFLPLTHLVAGARKVITEGASLVDISYHITALLVMSTVFLSLGSYLFSWNAER
ncbi:MAG: ABC transporter permease [Alteromonadaceae bacterium]|nr:ABC transporter permease [Alteromonadaceae bacterium]